MKDELCPKCKSDQVFENGYCTQCFSCKHTWNHKTQSWLCRKHGLNNMLGMICPACRDDKKGII